MHINGIKYVRSKRFLLVPVAEPVLKSNDPVSYDIIGNLPKTCLFGCQNKTKVIQICCKINSPVPKFPVPT